MAQAAAWDDGRARAFRRARRNSAVVRVLRLIFPALSLGVLGLYGVLFFEVASLVPTVDKSLTPRILPDNLTMQNPRYEGYTKDGGSYVFTAKAASQSLAQTHLVGLSGIEGALVDGNKVRTGLTAVRGEFDTKANTLDLSENIDVSSSNGLKAKLERAKVDVKESVLVSDAPVTVEAPAGVIRANRMTLRQKLREATFADAVVARLNPPEARAPAAPAPKVGSEGMAFGSPGEPIDVTASRLDLNDAAKTATFAGDVVASQGVSKIRTPELQIFYEGDAAAGAAGPEPQNKSGKLRRILAKEPVVLTRGETETVTAKSAEFDAATEDAIVAGDVVIVSLPDRRVEADRAEFNSRGNSALLTGAVVVTQGENVMAGRRLFLDRKSGTTHLSSPAEKGSSAGRIRARLIQKGAKAKAAASGAGPAETAAIAPKPALGGGAFKTDPSAPVEIDAETLEVSDPKRVATFRGAVTAKQGAFAISASELQAHYTGQAGIADQGGAKAGAGPAEITHIDARGAVKIVPEGGQTARGDWAKFDLKTNKAVLGGDVTLTQGRSVVAGRRLTIDMATGEAVIGDEAAPALVAGSPANSSQPGAAGAKRPQAVFYPKDLKEKAEKKIAPAVEALKAAKAKEDAAAPKSATSGWNATPAQ